MSGRKKKLSEKLKKYNMVLIISLVVLMVLLGVLMFYKMFGKNDYYKIESRKDSIAKSEKFDKEDFKTIGWLRVQGTNIDYPVYGIIKESFDYPVTDSYVWSLNMDTKFHETMVVYGHNVLNLGSQPIKHDEGFVRMEELMNFVYYDFAQSNQYIQLSIDGNDYLYKIFAVNFMPFEELDEYPRGDWVKKDKNVFVDRLLSETIYDYDVDYDKDDAILSVVTCNRFFGDGHNYDLIVTGRQVKAGEKVDNYSVHRNKNYEKVDQILKGAENNESNDNVQEG